MVKIEGAMVELCPKVISSRGATVIIGPKSAYIRLAFEKSVALKMANCRIALSISAI